MIDEDLELVELQPRHRRCVAVLGTLTQVGLLIICVSAVWSVQPEFSARKWAGFGALALGLLGAAAVTRGRAAFSTGGKLATGLAAMIVLGLCLQPQLADVGNLAERLPPWLVAMSPGLAMLGVLVAAAFGLTYLGTLNSYQRHRHYPPFAQGLRAALLLVAVLGVVTYLCLRRQYELDPTLLPLLLGNVVQYYLLGVVVVNVSGRIGVGCSPQVLFAVTLLLAAVRNFLAAQGA